MNKVMLHGRLTRDPEVRNAQTGNDETMTIARYTIAVDRRNGKSEADFISCVAFGKNAEFAGKYMKKGAEFVVSGRIQTGSYTNKDGQKVYTTDVVIETQEFCGSKAEGGTAQPEPQPGFMVVPEGIEESMDLPFK